MTELETVRATTDSASLLITDDHATAWVVPAKSTPSLFDSNVAGERYPSIVVASAIAKARAPNGSSFRYPAYNLYGPSPVATRIDSIRVVRRGTLYRGQTPLPIVVLQRSNGTQLWIDEMTGVEVLSRGNAGPNRWWWHIRRGVTPPAASRRAPLLPPPQPPSLSPAPRSDAAAPESVRPYAPPPAVSDSSRPSSPRP